VPQCGILLLPFNSVCNSAEAENVPHILYAAFFVNFEDFVGQCLKRLFAVMFNDLQTSPIIAVDSLFKKSAQKSFWCR
jgi:hypothetical protein